MCQSPCPVSQLDSEVLVLGGGNIPGKYFFPRKYCVLSIEISFCSPKLRAI